MTAAMNKDAKEGNNVYSNHGSVGPFGIVGIIKARNWYPTIPVSTILCTCSKKLNGDAI
ncbi:hypothetical protein [Neolewinella agarilytica]|uniref:hypothetical protein n=1 Tax=Neolewinella agarilytica TaxID=478744 RepID=UPI002352901A|nr:hypothetical protein [Neolewinella agarilytica]